MTFSARLVLLSACTHRAKETAKGKRNRGRESRESRESRVRRVLCPSALNSVKRHEAPFLLLFILSPLTFSSLPPSLLFPARPRNPPSSSPKIRQVFFFIESRTLARPRAPFKSSGVSRGSVLDKKAQLGELASASLVNRNDQNGQILYLTLFLGYQTLASLQEVCKKL